MIKDTADLIGRILIAFIFFHEAINSIFTFEQTKLTMTEYGITWYQDILLVGVITILIFGALQVLIGYGANLGALLLLLYWIPFTFIVYSFWNDSDDIRRLHALYFSRNMAIAGGLLILFANGSGNYSVKRLIHVMRLPK